MTVERESEAPKVNTGRLSKLACWILQNTGDGIDRADIVARHFGVDRLYCGFYVDPCFGPTERRRHDRQYRHAQPRVTMTVKRLAKRGLVRLVRHGKHVKRICLTDRGRAMSNALDNSNYSEIGDDK